MAATVTDVPTRERFELPGDDGTLVGWPDRHPEFAGHVAKSLRRQFEAS